jgi:hypothetical protein
MSRSRKKPIVTISKAWDKFMEKAFRRKQKKQLREMEIEWDADKDWEEMNYKKMGDYGTKLAYRFEPGPEWDDWEEWAKDNCERMKRK